MQNGEWRILRQWQIANGEYKAGTAPCISSCDSATFPGQSASRRQAEVEPQAFFRRAEALGRRSATADSSFDASADGRCLALGVIRVEKPELRDGLETRPTTTNTCLTTENAVTGRIRYLSHELVAFAGAGWCRVAGVSCSGLAGRGRRFCLDRARSSCRRYWRRLCRSFRFFSNRAFAWLEKKSSSRERVLCWLFEPAGGCRGLGFRCLGALCKNASRRGLPALLDAGSGRFIRPNLPYLCLAGATLFFCRTPPKTNEERRSSRPKAKGRRLNAQGQNAEG